MRRVSFLFLFILSCLSLEAAFGNSLYVGPETFRMRRWRPGGTVQKGRIDGIRFGYERLCDNTFYINLDMLIAKGKLKGHTGRGRRLRSEITDYIFEGKLGYTFVKSCPCTSFIAPYLGGGYFRENNEFISPSPILFEFRDTFGFFSVGFLSGLYFTPCLSLGLDLDVRFMFNGKSKVTDDPIYDRVTLIMNNESFYRVEVPLNYDGFQRRFGFKIAPFYEHRHFGGRVGFPFDFVNTKFDLLGIQFAISFLF